MKADEAVGTVVELEILRTRVRADLRPQASVRVPLLVFGTLTLGSAIVAAAASGAWLGAYWIVAAPAGMAGVSRHFRGLRQRLGAGPDGRAIMLVAIAMGIAVYAAGSVGGAVGAGVALGVGYLVMAAVLRSETMAWLGGALIVASSAVAATEIDAHVALPAAIGAALLGTGLAQR